MYPKYLSSWSNNIVGYISFSSAFIGVAANFPFAFLGLAAGPGYPLVADQAGASITR